MDNFALLSCVLNASVMLISTIGNSLLLAVILRTPSLRSPSIVFLWCVAVSDLIVGLVVQPVFIAYKPDPVLNSSSNTLLGIGCSVSLSTMTAMSVDRFLALHYHMRYPNLMTEKRAFYAAATIWFICILVACLRLWKRSRAVLVFAVFFCLLISTFSYIRIYRVVRRHQSQIYAQQQAVESFNAEQNLNMVRSRKSAINTFIYHICMIFCYFPWLNATLVSAFYSDLSTKERFLIGNILIFMNSSMNPILFWWRLRELRIAVVKLLRRLLCFKIDKN